jgi:hypothetical protein
VARHPGKKLKARRVVIKDGRGNLLYYLARSVDITPREEHEERMRVVDGVSAW